MGKRYKLSDSDVSNILIEFERGDHVDEIAFRYGCSSPMVYKLGHDNGIKRDTKNYVKGAKVNKHLKNENDLLRKLLKQLIRATPRSEHKEEG